MGGGLALVLASLLLAVCANCSERGAGRQAQAPGYAALPGKTAAPVASAPGPEWFGNRENKAEKTKASQIIRIAAAGDVMLQRRCNRSARQRSQGDDNNFGYDELFPGLSKALAGADAALANIEFPVFEKPQPERDMVFYGTTPALRALKKAGFTILTAANNHSYDHGPVSPASTALECKATGSICLGVGETGEEAERPYIVKIKGARLAFIGYTTLMNSNFNRSRPDAPRVNGKDLQKLVEEVKAAAAQSDGVVVMIHWGQEYRAAPLKWQYSQARELIEAGAVLIIGHHPHVLERVEPITAPNGRRALVAYSLGNFLTNQGRSSLASTTRLGAILTAELQKTPLGVEVVSWECLPTWVENRAGRFMDRPVEDVHVEVVPLMIAALNDELNNAMDDKSRAAIQKKINFYQGRMQAAERILAAPRYNPAEEPAPIVSR
jgi:poly-gamma-glutamate synthesis protein (capsule biosynthesis protein)